VVRGAAAADRHQHDAELATVAIPITVWPDLKAGRLEFDGCRLEFILGAQFEAHGVLVDRCMEIDEGVIPVIRTQIGGAGIPFGELETELQVLDNRTR